jgi:4-hydroxybutyrate CoA-transferase
MLVQVDNLVAVNNALLVDLTGQVASEGFGTRVWTGVGGQTAFMIAAKYSRGGRSVTVTPSSHSIDGKRVTRIVPALPEGTAVTVPRTFVDYVVTEQGIATLRGKTIRERVEELIAVSHPDFRTELREAARRMYAV